MSFQPPEKMATVTLLCDESDEEGAWFLTIESEDGSVDFDRHGKTPGALLDWADKWARDRGLWLGIVRTEAYRPGVMLPDPVPPRRPLPAH